jgi:PAS domain S-box-containing protein
MQTHTAQLEAALAITWSVDWPSNCDVRSMEALGVALFRNTFVRYFFAIATVASTFALRMWLVPIIGTDAPLMLFFAAVLAISLVAGIGPGIWAVVISAPFAAYTFVTGAGDPPLQAAIHGLLFAVEGIVVVYLAFRMTKERQAAHDANQLLQRANEEIIGSMRRTHEVVELAPDAFFQADLDGRFTDVNQAACRLLGYERDELIGKTIFDIIPAEDADRLKAVRADLLQPGRVNTAEWTQKRKDRTLVPVEVSSNILPDGRWQAFVRDVSERKRVERALHESEERFRLTIDEAPIGMALVALDGRFVRVNRALSEIIGYTPAELMALRSQAITHPDDLDANLALARELARGEIPRIQLVRRYIRKDGTIVDIQLSASVLRTREGAPLYYIVQAEDITERKRAEAALKDSERRLALALDSAQMGMWDLDLLTDTSVRSLRHDQIFGYSAAVPTWGMAVFMNHVVPEDRDVARLAFEQAFVSDNFDLECRIRWADESLHWISAKGRVVYRNPKGDPVRMMGTVLDVTGQKDAQEALLRSEREFRELAEAMPQIVWATGADGRNIYFNQQWVDYTGLTREESYGAGWITPFHPDDRQRAWDAWQRALLHRDAYSLECRLRRADGVYRWWLSRGVPLLSANGEIRKWFGTYTDIEQIKRIEHELKDANAFLDAIIENIPLVLFIKESQSLRYVRLNHTGEDLLGWSRQIFQGKTDYDLWPRAQAEFFIEKDREALNEGKVIDIAEEPVKTRHQGVRFLHTKKVPVHDATGQTTYLLGISEDITERRRIERERQFLAEANLALFSSLDYEETLATIAQLVVRAFADWCVVEIVEEHEHLQRLKAASANPANAARCAELEQWPIDRNRPFLVQAVVEKRQPLLIEHVSSEHLESIAQGPEHLQVLRSLGPTSLVAVPLLIRGQLLGTIAFVSSTASRVYGPDDLRLALALADRAVLAIENARLYRASVHATELRDQVLGIVAHDLRNPLSTILLNAAALKRHGPDGERRSPKRRDAIHNAATRMNRLIQDLLDVSVMESGQLTIQPARLSAHEVIAKAVETQKPLASSSSLDLRIDLDRDLPDIWGDRDRLLQVFENLIGNAIKFTKAGGCITVGAASRDHQIIFRVADTGSGIAPENLPRVFDRFWQATAANRRQGAGLGLPITKGIVEAHGGRIWVESTPSRGTTFWFTVPQAAPDQGRPSGPSGSSVVEGYQAA